MKVRSTNFLRFIQLTIWLLAAMFLAASFPDQQRPASTDAATYPADVVTSWITLQLKIAQTTPVPPPFTLRRFAYTGVTLYESIAPGLSGYQSIATQLNGLPAMPTIRPNASYCWPASANAAMAAISRALYTATSPANKAAIDSLEAANTAIYKKDRPADELVRSAEFGQKIAAIVFAWSQTDGHDNKTPFTVPTGSGMWVPTPPGFMAAALPNWGKCRPMLNGSDTGADQGLPVSYSEDPASPYYAQAKEVYTLSQKLTPEQKIIALFWADDPDGKSYNGGHWISILNQQLRRQKATLGMAAMALAQLGIAGSEAGVCIFKEKYRYNGLRPVTFIQKVMNQPSWSPLIPTPPHPEYPSGHALASGAAAQTLTQIFGANYKFSDESYTAIGFSPRSYNSFEDAAIEAGISRVYAGIHYRKSCDVSRAQGQQIARNVAQKLKFKL